MDYETIEFDVADGIASIRLNRPGQRNSISARMRVELGHAVDRLRAGEDAKDIDARVLVLSAAGDIFCAGGDVKDMGRKRSAAMVRGRIVSVQSWFSKLINLEMPVIAAVDGPAIGAGFSLALAADFIVASPRAKFTCAFARVGLMPDLSLLFMLPRMVGLQRAKELVLAARTIEAEEAKALGIVYELVPEGQADSVARELANGFRKAPVGALGMSKVLLNRSFEMDQHAMVEYEALAQGIAVNSDAHHAAVDNFINKRPYDYSGIARPKR